MSSYLLLRIHHIHVLLTVSQFVLRALLCSDIQLSKTCSPMLSGIVSTLNIIIFYWKQCKIECIILEEQVVSIFIFQLS